MSAQTMTTDASLTTASAILMHELGAGAKLTSTFHTFGGKGYRISVLTTAGRHVVTTERLDGGQWTHIADRRLAGGSALAASAVAYADLAEWYGQTLPIA